MGADDKTRIQAERPHAGVGTQLSGIYELDARLASGGMGEVYRGHNIETGDLVAIKIVLPEFAEDETILKLFRKEASVLNHLSHEAVVRYHVFTVDPGIGRPYLAMEYVDGESLVDVMRRGPMPVQQARRLCHRLAAGLAAVHRAGAIHRDLSPDNIILPGGSVEKAKIIDFGIARSAKIGGGTLIGGRFAGKYNYVSPEQLGLFGGEVDEQSDIYSLGLVIAAALRGKPIDMGGSQAETVEKRRRVPDLSDVDEDLRPLLSDMLQPDPLDRPASMAEVARRARGGSGVGPAGDVAEDDTEWPHEAFPAAGDAPWQEPDMRAASSFAPGNASGAGGGEDFVRHVRPALPSGAPQTASRPAVAPPAEEAAPGRQRRIALVVAGAVVLIGGGALLGREVVTSLVPGPGPGRAVRMSPETKRVAEQETSPKALPQRPKGSEQPAKMGEAASGRPAESGNPAAAVAAPPTSAPARTGQNASPSPALKSDDILKRLLAQARPAGSEGKTAGKPLAEASVTSKAREAPPASGVPASQAQSSAAATAPEGGGTALPNQAGGGIAGVQAPLSPTTGSRLAKTTESGGPGAAEGSGEKLPAGPPAARPLVSGPQPAPANASAPPPSNAPAPGPSQQSAGRIINAQTPAPVALSPPVLQPAPLQSGMVAMQAGHSPQASDRPREPARIATAAGAAAEGTDSRPPPFDAAPVPPSKQGTVPAEVPKETKSAEVAMSLQRPSIPAPGRDPIAQRVAWVHDFSGGSCFFASTTAMTMSAARVEGLGSAVEPFVQLMDSFKKKFGVEPDIQIGMIASSQCAVPDFLRSLPSSAEAAPMLKVDNTSIADGGRLSGTLEARGGPYVSLLLIDHDGMTFSLDRSLSVQGGKATFSIPIKLGPGENVPGKPHPEILVAIEGGKGIDATSLPRPLPASEALPRILSEIRRSGAGFAATAKYIQLGG